MMKLMDEMKPVNTENIKFEIRDKSISKAIFDIIGQSRLRGKERKRHF